jgi:hypothetical protein
LSGSGLRVTPGLSDPIWDFMRDDERFNELVRPPNLEQSIHVAKDSTR